MVRVASNIGVYRIPMSLRIQEVGVWDELVLCKKPYIRLGAQVSRIPLQ